MKTLIGLFVLLFAGQVAAGVTIKDDDGNALQLDAPAQRVVTLGPHLAELMYDASAGDALVGTVEWSNWPPQAEKLPRIGDAFRVDYERIIQLHPDVILAWGGGTPRPVILRLRELGMKVAVLSPDGFERIADNLRFIGQLTGHADAANEAARKFLDDVDALRDHYAKSEKVTVFYQIASQPLFTVNGRHYISKAVELCGGKNVFADLNQLAPAVSREAVLARNPQVMLAGKFSANISPLSDWNQWKNVTAVKKGNLFTVPAELLARPTLRVLEGARAVCGRLDEARANLKKPD